jgi:hypothetical protein
MVLGPEGIELNVDLIVPRHRNAPFAHLPSRRTGYAISTGPVASARAGSQRRKWCYHVG